MTFTKLLSQISKLMFFLGISPCSFNQKSNKFECSTYTLSYTIAYFLTISFAVFYVYVAFYLKDGFVEGSKITTTFTVLSLLQQFIVMIIFYSTLLDLIVKRQRHADFLNKLIDLDAYLVKLNMSTNYSSDLTSLHRQHILILFIYAIIHLSNSIIHVNYMRRFEHAWNVLQYFQAMSLTMVGYYIRCFVIILNHRCQPVFEYLDFVKSELVHTNHSQKCLAKLMKGFEAFDEIMNMKNQLSNIYGVQLLLNAAYDFTMLTISVYGILYYQTQNIAVLSYFVMYNLPHALNCVLHVLALDTLANQV